MKQNCWDYMKCGRERGGEKEQELGTCPAATEQRLNGIHGGRNGGRSCWVVPGTGCDVKAEGISDRQVTICTHCTFYRMVKREEENSFVFSGLLLKELINGKERHLRPDHPSR